MTFSILGHDAVVKGLEALLREGRLPHALLFVGPEGVGKRRVAMNVAASLLCEKSPRHCGACTACRLLEQAKHPDFTLIQPEEGKIKIDTIRELKKDFAFAPLMGKARVLLIVDAHVMNIAAANALLKTLEEPPAETYFILLSHAPGWIPRTIVSRCQKVRFGPLSPALMEKILPEKPSAQTLDWAQGSARYAAAFAALQSPVPTMAELEDARSWGFGSSYRRAQEVVDAEELPVFLEALLAQIHQRATREASAGKSFELLLFADRILEFKKNLRVNANPRLHLARLLMHFQEPLQSRL